MAKVISDRNDTISMCLSDDMDGLYHRLVEFGPAHHPSEKLASVALQSVPIPLIPLFQV